VRPAPSDPPEIEQTLWKDITGACAWYVGANTGQSLDQLRRRFNFVVAFEPAEECWDLLPQHPDVQVVRMAVSDVNGEILLAAPPSKIATGQLVTPGTWGMEWDADEPGTMFRTVPARSIDTLTETLPPPSFILVDVEGHEAHVLNGAHRTISHYRPAWLIEFHTPELHDIIEHHLAANGYHIETIRHPHYQPETHMWWQHGWIKALPE